MGGRNDEDLKDSGLARLIILERGEKVVRLGSSFVMGAISLTIRGERETVVRAWHTWVPPALHGPPVGGIKEFAEAGGASVEPLTLSWAPNGLSAGCSPNLSRSVTGTHR